ncbi:MAG: hypothetical protein WCB05_19520 [Candidatus Sulfotelmatobacter sp.]
MSTLGMCEKIVRVLAWFVAAVLASILLLAAAIRVDQYVLRYRAERLQSDIRSLELRRSTFADARRLEDRWFDKTKEKVCRPSWCDLDISLNNTSARHLEFFLNHLAVRALYHSLGGRAAGAYAFIQVRDNILWGKGIGVGIETLDTEPDGRRVEYALLGRIGTDSPPWVRARHPEYQIGRPDACTSCVDGWVKFTPFADPRDVSRLTDLNFTCITRWRHCTEQADILPTAWKELRAEIAEGAGNDPNPCTPAVIRSLSRQTHRLELLKVIKLKPDPNLPLMTVRLLSGSAPQRPDQWQEFDLPADLIGLGVVQLGEQFLMFDNGACRAVPATEENLKAARLGAVEGWISPAHPLDLPFGKPSPPEFDVH